MSRKKL